MVYGDRDQARLDKDAKIRIFCLVVLAIPGGRGNRAEAAPVSPLLQGDQHVDPKKQLLSLADEFKSFALKGNVIDLAVGVIIGSAFGSIVTSLVKNIIMPIVSIPIPTQGGYTAWHIGPILVGHFLSDVLNFVVVALALFLFIVKFLGFILRTKKEAPPPPLTKDQELLIEIRDLLKNQK
jgi:large conductance mechanosensitive channel